MCRHILSWARFRFSFVCVVVLGAMPLCLGEDGGAIAASAPTPMPGEALSLAQAVALALERNPRLAAYSWDIRAAEAREIQARLRPNPELSVEIEDVRLSDGPDTRVSNGSFGWSAEGLGFQADRELESGASRGLSEAQFTISLSQIIELGGKRSQRMRLAARARDVSAWDYEIARADVLKSVAQTFAETLASQQRVALDEELVRLAEEVYRTVSLRVTAGRVSPLEAARAETALAASREQAHRARRVLDAARIRLAALWGDTEACFDRVEGDLSSVRDIPPLDQLAQRIEKHPELAGWRAESEKRRTSIGVERSKGTPDLTVAAGFRARGLGDRAIRSVGIGTDGISYSRGNSQSDGDWDHSIVLEFSIPLPLFDRNQGAIMEAEHLAAKAGEEFRAASVALHAQLREAYYGLAADLEAIRSLRQSILPSAAQTFESVNEAYRQGKFGYLDVLDAQRTLFEARHEYLEALAGYHRYVAEIERALGGPLWDAPANPSEKKEIH